MSPDRLYLSPPHMGGTEMDYIRQAFSENWISPLGPNVDAFEAEFCDLTGAPHAVALSSGTAALHLALLLAGVEPGDVVPVSTLTFAGSVNPILYAGAEPVFVDSEDVSWNIDPALLEEAVSAELARGRRVGAIIVVHLYGQTANLEPVLALCREHGIPLIEDAAEALGADYRSVPAGTLGDLGVFSFNGNKIITTSGGGMLVAREERLAARARKLATQAREPAPHYEHAEVGYNYRLSNVLAGIGRGQLEVLEERVLRRREIFSRYLRSLGDMPGLDFMPEAEWGRHTRWLTTLTVDGDDFGADRDAIRLALEAENIEARPVWKPMHRQPVYRDFRTYGGEVSERLFADGLCLPSGSLMSDGDIDRVIEGVRACRGG